MPGILNAATQADYADPQGQIWTYFQDLDDASIYYVVQAPGLKLANGAPQFHLTEYVDGQGAFVSGLCQLATALQTPPASVTAAIESALQGKGVASPVYQAMPYADLGSGPQRNWAHLAYADATGVVSRSVSAIPSLSGDQQALFEIPDLTAAEARFFRAYFSGAADAGTVEVSYRLTVTAHMAGVTARVQFDAQKAYEYQRTFKWVS
jgi:hypothetical protein